MKLKSLLHIFPWLLVVGLAAYCAAIRPSRKHYIKKEIATISIDANILKEKLAKEPPEWMIRQIERDLSAFPKGLNRSLLDRAFYGDAIADFQLIRFQIQNRRISFAHDEKNLYSRHFRELLACIQKLNESTVLPDVDFIVSLEDGFDANPGLGPTFVFAKQADVKGLLLIPDIKAMTGYGKLRPLIEQGNDRYSWDKKKNQAFWRGSTTGGYLTASTWDAIARCRLVLISKQHPQEVDARFPSIVQCDPEIPQMMKQKGLVGKSVSKLDHLKYKYLVDVDGNSCSYERYFWLLLSNSVVLKQVTKNIQWYYGALEPYRHFIPVKEDLTDLVEKINWAKSHDAEAMAIAENGSKFAKENLGAEDTLVYLYHLICRYAGKFSRNL